MVTIVPTGDAGLDTLLAAIVPVLRPEEVWLFGSRARGDHRPDSDYDLLLVMPDDAPRERVDLIEANRTALSTNLPADLIPVRRHRFERFRNAAGFVSHAATARGRRVYCE